MSHNNVEFTLYCPVCRDIITIDATVHETRRGLRILAHTSKIKVVTVTQHSIATGFTHCCGGAMRVLRRL